MDNASRISGFIFVYASMHISHCDVVARTINNRLLMLGPKPSLSSVITTIEDLCRSSYVNLGRHEIGELARMYNQTFEI